MYCAVLSARNCGCSTSKGNFGRVSRSKEHELNHKDWDQKMGREGEESECASEIHKGRDAVILRTSIVMVIKAPMIPPLSISSMPRLKVEARVHKYM